MDILRYTIKEKSLKDLGYTFQKLYARNYKTYRKEFKNNRTIWLWVKDKRLEVDDWFDHTGNILQFYKDHINSPEFNRINPTGKASEYAKIRLNTKTGEIIHFNYEEYYEVLMSNLDIFDDYDKKYEDFREIVFYKPFMPTLLAEIDFLTK